MKRRFGLIRACIVGVALANTSGLTAALAQDATAKPKLDSSDAFAAADPIPYMAESNWWFHGTIEAGGRFFLNNPPRNGSVYRGRDSLAKYYEYSDIRPGAFGNADLSAGSKDGVYQIDLGGKNIGYDDQQYYLDASKAGEHYFNFGWDQTPHLYSTSAQTFFQGVGTTSLTLPPGFVKAAGAAIPGSINPFLYQTDIGIRRDTASFDYRWTPDDAWDLKANYSHMHRFGTQVDGLITTGFGGGGPSSVSVPRPVDDTTQNYGVNGEYAGTSPWSQKYTFKVAYNGSQYSDDFTSYTVQNPLTLGAAVDRLSTWPSNNANGFSGTLGADLPSNSHYAGTLSYTMMRQNDAFIPMSTQNPGFPLPASSLNGAINTLLSNNILTTKIAPELTSKLSYRYYNFDNDTPQLFFPCTGVKTTNCTTAWISLDGAAATEKQVQSLSMQYTKQNANAELTWRPSREWNLGAAYGFEQYNYTQVDATSTSQNMGKVFADWKPATWFGTRSSASYSERTASNYNYFQNVGFIQFPGTTPAGNNFFYNPGYLQFMIDHRREWKANFAVDVVVVNGLILTPTFKYQDDYYGINPALNMGLDDSRVWSAGLDATYTINRDASVMVGYMREYYSQYLFGVSSNSNSAVLGVGGVFGANTNDLTTVDTFTAMVRYAAIPDKLDLSARYSLSRGVDRYHLDLTNGTAPTGGQFPDDTTWFQRLDAIAVYTFDKTEVAQMGWKGDVKAKLHYAWERSAVSNWQNDTVAVYNPTFASGTNAIFMAYDNPNYNVHILMASLAFTW